MNMVYTGFSHPSCTGTFPLKFICFAILIPVLFTSPPVVDGLTQPLFEVIAGSNSTNVLIHSNDILDFDNASDISISVPNFVCNPTSATCFALTWDLQNSNTSYTIDINQGMENGIIVNTNDTRTYAELCNVTTGNFYNVSISAKSIDGIVGATVIQQCSTSLPAPTGVIVAVDNQTCFTVSWTAIYSVSSYTARLTSSLATTISDNSEENSVQLCGLEAATMYNASVKAIYQAGESSFSTEIVTQITDVDRCAKSINNKCADNAFCNNTVGGYTCTCNAGYSGDGFICIDINECTIAIDDCSSFASCVNIDGSFTCNCNSGFTGDGFDCTETSQLLTTALGETSTIYSTATIASTSPQLEPRFNATVVTSFTTQAITTIPVTLPFSTTTSTTTIRTETTPVATTKPSPSSTSQASTSKPFSSTTTTRQTTQVSSTTSIATSSGTNLLPNIINPNGSINQEDLAKILANSITPSFAGDVVDILENFSSSIDADTDANDTAAITQFVSDLLENIKLDPEEIFTKNTSTLVLKAYDTFGDTDATFSSTGGRIEIPGKFIQSATNRQKREDGNETIYRLAFNEYSDARMFIQEDVKSIRAGSDGKDVSFANDERIVNSAVIGVSVGGKEIRNSSETVKIRLNLIIQNESKSEMDNGTVEIIEYKNPECSWWNYTEGKWATEGCIKSKESPTYVVCACNHLTNFAVIMQVGTRLDDIILTYLSYIGAGLSILGLIGTILSYSIFKTLRKHRSKKILLHFCSALCGVYISYLFGIAVNLPSNQAQCIASGFFLHFFTLSVMTWMCVEVIDMYIMFVKIFWNSFDKYMLKACLFGWLIPFIISTLTVGIHLGTTNLQIYPTFVKNNKTICWLDKNGMLYGFIVPSSIILLFNLIIFSLVLYNITCKRSSNTHIRSTSNKIKPTQHIINAFAVLLLSGPTWIIGYFINIDPVQDGVFRRILSYVFVILNGFQGLWIFIVFSVRPAPVRKRWIALLTRVFSSTKHSVVSSVSGSQKYTDKSRTVSTRTDATNKNLSKRTIESTISVVSSDSNSSKTSKNTSKVVSIYLDHKNNTEASIVSLSETGNFDDTENKFQDSDSIDKASIDNLEHDSGKDDGFIKWPVGEAVGTPKDCVRRFSTRGLEIVESFICDVCNKGFTTNDEMQCHVKSSHKKFRHQCSGCENSFYLRPALEKHLLSCPSIPANDPPSTPTNSEQNTSNGNQTGDHDICEYDVRQLIKEKHHLIRTHQTLFRLQDRYNFEIKDFSTGILYGDIFLQQRFRFKITLALGYILRRRSTGVLEYLYPCDNNFPIIPESCTIGEPKDFEEFTTMVEDIEPFEWAKLQRPDTDRVVEEVVTLSVSWYDEHGLEIQNINQVIQFTPTPSFEKFGDLVSIARREGDSAPVKAIIADAIKLLGNSAYGKFVSIMEKHRNVKFCRESKAVELINESRFRKLSVLSEDVYEVEMSKAIIEWDLPLQIGFNVYNFAKLRMQEFYYDFMDEYLDRSDFDLCKMDTDSFFFGLSGSDIKSIVKPEKWKKFSSICRDWFVIAVCDAHRHEMSLLPPAITNE